MEGKKISFSFMKTKKAEKPVSEEKKDFIECVEEKSIKVVGGEEVTENTPLIIPMKPNTLVTAERLKQIAEKVESALEEPEVIEKPPVIQRDIPDNETLDQMAIRELLQDAKKEVNIETPTLTVPMPARPINEGESESTLDDYESVPVQDYGIAMLRGMGWAPNKEKSSYKQPQLRPKGLGLGADKVVKSNQKQKSSKGGKEEDLTIVKNAYVKITTGKYSGYYGKVLSLDEDNGRVMVDISVKKETVSLSEFMMHPVSKSEFDKESKVINAASYEEYKKKDTTQNSSKNIDKGDHSEKKFKDKHKDEDKYSEREPTTSRSNENKYDRDEKSSRHVEKNKSVKNGKDSEDKKDEERKERDRDRSHRSKQRIDSSEERSSRKNNKKYDSNESLDSLSDTERKRHKKKERKRYSSQESLSSHSDTERKKKNTKKEKKRHDSSDSEPDYRNKRNKTPEGKRDIDKKRKGKKKKRDRDRSPNYRKHRK